MSRLAACPSHFAEPASSSPVPGTPACTPDFCAPVLSVQDRLPLPDDAIRHVRSLALAMERRLLAGQSGVEDTAGDPLSVQRLQEQIVHLARVATVGALAASIAHEINQPLTAIRVESHAIQRWMDRDTPHAAEIADGVRRIQNQSERAEQVIRSLRALMRREPATQRPFALDHAILEIVPLVNGAVSDADVNLQFDLPAGLPELVGDRVQIQQVVLNLLLNALEAVRERATGTATVRLRTFQPERDRITVEVTDNGAGIPADMLDTIFEPFFSTRGDGMGIGLAICRSIVEFHGGTVRAASGNGITRMAFTLPVRSP